MDERLKRRLIGAALLLLVAFALASMVPEPRLRRAGDTELQVVAIDLDEQKAAAARTPADDAPLPTAVARPQAPPPVDETAGEEDSPPAIETAALAAPTPAPQIAPTPPPAATPAAPPTVMAASERWWVQIGSYSEIGNARQVETQLRALGEPVIVAPIDTAQGVLYRVRAGPYASEDRAGTAHARIVAAGHADARLIRP